VAQESVDDQFGDRGFCAGLNWLARDDPVHVPLAWNDNLKPFVWAKTAEQLVDSLGRLVQRINGARH
jgi:hypothetical protein